MGTPVAEIITAVTGAVVAINGLNIWRVNRQVKSPNGHKTGVQVDNIRQMIEAQAEGHEACKELLEDHLTHPTLHTEMCKCHCKE